MRHSERVQNLFSEAQHFYNNGDPGHDVAHILRVMNTCEQIGKSEGADIELLLAAAILHDVVNLPKDHPERLQASKMAAEKSRDILVRAGFADDEIVRITEVITEHSYSLDMRPTSVESAILQDADKLDALGAIGIMRAVTCGYRLGSAYYDLQDPLARSRPLDDKRFTADHFSTKLFKLPALMNTEAGRVEANRRMEFMRHFLTELWTEAGIEEQR